MESYDRLKKKKFGFERKRETFDKRALLDLIVDFFTLSLCCFLVVVVNKVLFDSTLGGKRLRRGRDVHQTLIPQRLLQQPVATTLYIKWSIRFAHVFNSEKKVCCL